MKFPFGARPIFRGYVGFRDRIVMVTCETHRTRQRKQLEQLLLRKLKEPQGVLLAFFVSKKSTELNKSTESTLSFEFSNQQKSTKFILGNSWKQLCFFLLFVHLWKSPAINTAARNPKVPRPQRSWLSVTSMSAMKKTRVARKGLFSLG